MRRAILFTIAYFLLPGLQAQLTVSGRVFDITKVNLVENVRVVSTGGLFTFTDSMGRFSIQVFEKDSLLFYYRNKPTQKFAVAEIHDPSRFEVSLHVPVQGKYSVLKEVVVYSKSYRQDSIENRRTYADVFNYAKPGVESTVSPDGVAGADVNELINIFRFRRNRRLKEFQARLEKQEQERYVDYRFNKTTVRRITGLNGEQLDSFLVWYRPEYAFTRESDELAFNQYILNAFYQFRKLYPAPAARKPGE